MVNIVGKSDILFTLTRYEGDYEWKVVVDIKKIYLRSLTEWAGKSENEARTIIQA